MCFPNRDVECDAERYSTRGNSRIRPTAISLVKTAREKESIELQPDDASAHNNLGVTYNDLGRADEAILEYQIALELKPDYVQPHNNLGNTYKSLGRLNDAIEEYQMALKLNPNYVIALYNLGAAYKNTGRFNEAINAYERALIIKPDFDQARQALESLKK